MYATRVLTLPNCADSLKPVLALTRYRQDAFSKVAGLVTGIAR